MSASVKVGRAGFKHDLFEDTDSNKQLSLFGVAFRSQAFLREHFSSEQIDILKKSSEGIDQISVDIDRIRRKVRGSKKSIELASNIRIYALVQNEKNVENEKTVDLQDEITEIGERCPAILSLAKDKNTFFRAFMIQFLVKLVFFKRPTDQQTQTSPPSPNKTNNHNRSPSQRQSASTKNNQQAPPQQQQQQHNPSQYARIFTFIERINQLQKYDCRFPGELYSFKLVEHKTYLIGFILKLLLIRVTEEYPVPPVNSNSSTKQQQQQQQQQQHQQIQQVAKELSLEKIFKVYNDSPEVDISAIVIMKNLMAESFEVLYNHAIFKHLIDEHEAKVVPQIISAYEELVPQCMLPIIVDAFECNLILVNDTRAEQPEYFVPQTRTAVNEDIFLYRGYNGFFHSVFEKNFAQKYMSFCLLVPYVYQNEDSVLVELFKNATDLFNSPAVTERTAVGREERRWRERAENIQKFNEEKEAKEGDKPTIPILACCECDRELSDFVPLLKFDIYYFCEACITEMVSRLNREDKTFTYIGQSQVKRYQLRDAVQELKVERDRLKAQADKKLNAKTLHITNATANFSVGSEMSAENYMTVPTNARQAEKFEKRWAILQTQCLKCNDECQEELVKFQEVITQREVAVCISCIQLMNETIGLSYRNIKTQGKFELSNAEIKAKWKDLLVQHGHQKLKYVCAKCVKIRLVGFVLPAPAASVHNPNPSKQLLCRNCFIDIFQQDDRLKLYGISLKQREELITAVFAADFNAGKCVSCEVISIEALTIESEIVDLSLGEEDEQVDTQQSLQSKTLIKSTNNNNNNKSIQSQQQQTSIMEGYSQMDPDFRFDNTSQNTLSTKRRFSKICPECIFKQIGECKNLYMDYLITYKRLRTNIVYRYNMQVKTFLEQDVKRAMLHMASICVLCLRKLKDLHMMNEKGERVCTDCFLKHREVFAQNNGFVDGFECHKTYMEAILTTVLQRMHDQTQCIGCSERIKTFDYEVMKIAQSFSNVVVCDSCIFEQLADKPVDIRSNYTLQSRALNEVIYLQNKREVDVKITGNQKAKTSGLITSTSSKLRSVDDKNSAAAAAAGGDSSRNQQEEQQPMLILPQHRNQLNSRDYPELKCYNTACVEVALAAKNGVDLRFIKMPKCHCTFCFACLMAYYMKMVEVRTSKQTKKLKDQQKKEKLKEAESGIETKAKGRLISMSVQGKNAAASEEADDEHLFCPSNLCPRKYTEDNVKDLVNGYNVHPDDEAEEDGSIDPAAKRQSELLREQHRRKTFQAHSISCTICRKDKRPLAEIFDEFLIMRAMKDAELNAIALGGHTAAGASVTSMQMESLKNAGGKKKKQKYYGGGASGGEDISDAFESIEGFCECTFACKPCLFSLYYLDRCNRCLKKPSPHIYKILFNFKKNMICPQCQNREFKNLEDGPLLMRTDVKFQCKTCQIVMSIE